MNKDSIFGKFISEGVGEFIITDMNWNLLDKSGNIDIDEEKWLRWTRGNRENEEIETSLDWEVAEKSAGQYYSVRTRKIVDENEEYLAHYVYDISDYAGLFHDMTSYSREWHLLSTCQGDLISALSDDHKKILPIILKYLKTESALLFLDKGERLEVSELIKGSNITTKKLNKDSVDFIKDAGTECELNGFEHTYICCAGGKTVSGEEYGLYIRKSENIKDDLMPLYFNVFKLYIENALLRERIVFQYEHDAMTGLYNNGKYLELVKDEFGGYDAISVFYFDLNYLKRTNDTLGHEAGSKLICKAADSIKAVCDDDIFGFRTGGDEFVMIAKNADENKAKELRERWQEALDRSNREETDLECIVACGVSSASAPYDLKEVFSIAEGLMYEDKRRIKIARGDLPDAR